MKLNFLCFKQSNLLWAAPHGRPCLEWEGWRLFFYYIILQGTLLCILFHFLFPSVGRLQVRRGWQNRHVQMHNLWSVAVGQQPLCNWFTYACSQPSVTCYSSKSYTLHLDSTKILKWFKAGFYFGTLSGGEGWGFYLKYLIKPVTAKAGWHTYSPMPSLWGSWHDFPFCSSTLDMVFSYKYYLDQRD